MEQYKNLNKRNCNIIVRGMFYVLNYKCIVY